MRCNGGFDCSGQTNAIDTRSSSSSCLHLWVCLHLVAFGSTWYLLPRVFPPQNVAARFSPSGFWRRWWPASWEGPLIFWKGHCLEWLHRKQHPCQVLLQCQWIRWLWLMAVVIRQVVRLLLSEMQWQQTQMGRRAVIATIKFWFLIGCLALVLGFAMTGLAKLATRLALVPGCAMKGLVNWPHVFE